MERFVCIHGHFYQPPRENPWLEEVELQDSAYPFHDWNERITSECYAPNAASRVLDGEGRIFRIVNNYDRISFNFGATLLSWMERHAPETHDTIIEADRWSREKFSGHGSAMAQGYSHSILPLSHPRDKRTQVRWGLRDFQHRFGRDPEGMWLPETAVDIESLELLAEYGVKFTVLAPHQAHRVRPLSPGNENEWSDVTGGKIDPSRAYLQKLPSGRSIALFFYDGPVSQAVAFERLLTSGEKFADRIVSMFDENRTWPQLAHIATDGETYGHHHTHGEMALSFALRHIEKKKLATVTNYGEFLEKHPPEMEVQIYENTSWSCVHGVERWRSDCGCTTGGRPGWNQAWRKPLRESLDWLRAQLEPYFEQEAGQFLKDPWEARDGYIDVILDRSNNSISDFLGKHASRHLSYEDRVRAIGLLEMQRHAVLMFTSCGWFFDELSRIETTQVLTYACRAMQLTRDLGGPDFEPGFLERLSEAKSNLTEHGDGKRIYEKWIRPMLVDLTKVAAHYAISSLFERYADRDRIFSYSVEADDYRGYAGGKAKLALGRVRVRSEVLDDEAMVTFGVVHLGDHNITASVRHFQNEEAYQEMLSDIAEPFERGDFTATIRRLDKHFHEQHFSIKSLFRDEQRKILDVVLSSTLDDIDREYRRIVDDHFALMRFLSDTGAPLPASLRAAAEFVINADLKRLLSDPEPERGAIDWRLDAATEMDLLLDKPGLAFALEKNIVRSVKLLSEKPQDTGRLRECISLVKLANRLPFTVNLWETQNIVYAILRNEKQAMDEGAQGEWIGLLRELSGLLSIATA